MVVFINRAIGDKCDVLLLGKLCKNHDWNPEPQNFRIFFVGKLLNSRADRTSY